MPPHIYYPTPPHMMKNHAIGRPNTNFGLRFDQRDAEMSEEEKIKKDWKAFITAARKNDINYVKKFIECGGDVNNPKNPQSALHCAVFFDFVEMINLLLSAPGANVNQKDEDGDTPMHTAIGEKKGEKILKILLDNGASLHTQNNGGKTPLDYAKMLKNSFIIDSVAKSTKLCQRVEDGNIDEVTALLTYMKIDVNSVSEDGVTALHEAALNGNEEIASLLISKGASVNSLCQVGLAEKSTPLHCASSKGHVNIAKLLVEKGANLNEKNIQGQTPLHCATAQNHPEVAELLIQSNADVNALNFGGLLPIHYAIMEKMYNTIELLIKHGCNINHPGAKTSPILYARMIMNQQERFEMVKFLVNHGAIVDSLDVQTFSNPEITSFLEKHVTNK